jgi:hypothetical protein
MVCSNCGHALGPDDQYCGGCGAYLTDAPDDEYGEEQPDGTAQGQAPDPAQEDRWDVPYAPLDQPQPQPQPRSGPPAGMVAAAVAAVALVALLVFWVLRPDGEEAEAADPATTAAPSVTTPAATDDATDAATPSPTDTPTESPTEPPPATSIDLPGSAQECNNVGSFIVYRGNTATSCPFAENVGRAFAELDQPVTAEVSLSGVSSPVTGLDYDLTCEYTTPVRCTGGNNAAVYLVPAS